MTPDKLTPIIQQAQHNQRAGWGWCFLHPSQVVEMADAALRLEDAERRLAEIAALVPDALLDWACNYRDKERKAWAEVERLSKSVL